MNVAEAADAPVPQRPASAVAGVLLVALGALAPWVVGELYDGGLRWLHRPGTVMVVALGVVMLLGTVKRAFRGFDLGTLVALVTTVGLGRLTWTWVGGQGVTGVLHGAAVAAVAIGLGTALAWRRRDAEPPRQHLRRSAAITGWAGLATVALGAVAPSFVAPVFDIGLYWMPFFGAAFASGACALAGLVLGITALFRDRW